MNPDLAKMIENLSFDDIKDAARKFPGSRLFSFESFEYVVTVSEPGSGGNSVVVGSDGSDCFYEDFARGFLLSKRKHRMPQGYCPWEKIVDHLADLADPAQEKDLSTTEEAVGINCRIFIENCAPVYVLPENPPIIDVEKISRIGKSDFQPPFNCFLVAYPNGLTVQSDKRINPLFGVYILAMSSDNKPFIGWVCHAENDGKRIFKIQSIEVEELLRRLTEYSWETDFEIMSFCAAIAMSLDQRDQIEDSYEVEHQFKGFQKSKAGQSIKVFHPRWIRPIEEVPQRISRGGTHASPSTHFRRGHYRRMRDKQIWVKPCLVNAKVEQSANS